MLCICAEVNVAPRSLGEVQVIEAGSDEFGPSVFFSPRGTNFDSDTEALKVGLSKVGDSPKRVCQK